MTRVLAVLLIALLAGCGSTGAPAPVREAKPRVAKPAVPRPASPVPAGYYRVQPGDTLYKLAFEHGLDYRDLAQWNKLADPDRIRADDLMRITPPAPARVTVATAAMPAEPTIATRPLPAEPTLTAHGNQAENAHPIADPPEGPPDVWSWPSKGTLLARFGEGLSKGIDIGGAKGQPVQAAASGRVVYAGAGLRGYGKLIIIRHGKTLLSAYAHNARVLVAEGQSVTRGHTIAEMGNSDADRVKLHFEIREYGKPVDPLNYLPKLS